jgi:hypothetical protein
MEKRYQKANAKLYESMDWAIDVSEANCLASHLTSSGVIQPLNSCLPAPLPK